MVEPKWNPWSWLVQSNSFRGMETNASDVGINVERGEERLTWREIVA